MAKTLPVDKGEGGQVVTDFVTIVEANWGGTWLEMAYLKR